MGETIMQLKSRLLRSSVLRAWNKIPDRDSSQRICGNALAAIGTQVLWGVVYALGIVAGIGFLAVLCFWLI